MAKRFTDTNKWKDTWFQDLPNKYKLFWIYLLDECDAAGLWKPNMRLAQFQIGEPFEEIELKRVFADRISLTNDGYWFISKFIDFQYGELSDKSKPHLSIIRLLEKHKIKGYPKGIHTLKEKEKEKEKEQVKEIADHYYKNAETAYQELTSDDLLLEHIRMAVRPYWSSTSREQLVNIVKHFITIHGIPGGKVETDPKDEVRRYLMNWVNSKAKTIHEYAK